MEIYSLFWEILAYLFKKLMEQIRNAREDLMLTD